LHININYTAIGCRYINISRDFIGIFIILVFWVAIKNIFKSASFSMITILFLSLAFIKIYSPISTNLKMIASYEDFSSEEESLDQL
jgi:hypothetical protein